jgi:hypothetical protein
VPSSIAPALPPYEMLKLFSSVKPPNVEKSQTAGGGGGGGGVNVFVYVIT